jgi:hypothetical protein
MIVDGAGARELQPLSWIAGVAHQRGKGLDVRNRTVGARVQEGGDRSVTDAAPLVEAGEGLVDAEVVLVPLSRRD